MLELERRLSGVEPWNYSEPQNWRHDVRPSHVDLQLNMNSIPFEKDAAIIVTSWHGHLPFMKATLTGYRASGKFVVCAYDFPFTPFGNKDLNLLLPAADIWMLAHAWVFKHPTYDTVKREGWFWDIKYGGDICRQYDDFEYIFTVNSDCVWEEPGGVDNLIGMLREGDYDLMSVSAEGHNIHTAAVCWKREAFYQVLDYMTEFHRKPVLGSFSPELTMTLAIRQLNLKELVAPCQPAEPGMPGAIDHYCRYDQDSTWKQVVGFRNLQAEYYTRAIERLDPLPIRFMDLRYKHHLTTQGQSLLANYYETGDYRWIMKLWDENEDSWYDRLYYPIEYYGKEPILKEVE
ncbi:MAG TPA: hypothetical protein VMW36_10770 [Patescibacteria group bacterium]|nr:hypothetical protein [Patescibacteria group bacterium]